MQWSELYIGKWGSRPLLDLDVCICDEVLSPKQLGIDMEGTILKRVGSTAPWLLTTCHIDLKCWLSCPCHLLGFNSSWLCFQLVFVSAAESDGPTMDANVNAVEYYTRDLMTFLTMYVLGILFRAFRIWWRPGDLTQTGSWHAQFICRVCRSIIVWRTRMVLNGIQGNIEYPGFEQELICWSHWIRVQSRTIKCWYIRISMYHDVSLGLAMVGKDYVKRTSN